MDGRRDIKSILGAHPFLNGLKPEHIARVAECASMVDFRADQVLFHAGERADHCFLLREGRVAVGLYDAGRDAVILQTLGPSSVLGWSWLIPPYQWCFDARALEATCAIALEAGYFRDLCERDHVLGHELLKRFVRVFAERLHSARFQLLDMHQAYHRQAAGGRRQGSRRI